MQFDALPKSFCDCWSYQNTKQRTCSCVCGEEDSRDREWQWEQNDYPTTKLVDETTVIFHPIYSQGTSVVSIPGESSVSRLFILTFLQVRGNTPLAPGRHHFWEIKMTSTVCGTDLMVGVGTAQVDLMANKYRFVSALGLDSRSWGYSYRGVAQHDNVSRLFGQKFGAGSIVSCHLDLFRGTLEFYLNRLPLGIAFRNLAVDGSCEYYPMVSSTAAKSSVKLLNSSSFPECLQYQSMVAISRYPSVLNKLLRLPQGFRYKDKLWYLQRTEKFKYSRKQPANNRQDLLFEETTGAFEGTTAV